MENKCCSHGCTLKPEYTINHNNGTLYTCWIHHGVFLNH